MNRIFWRDILGLTCALATLFFFLLGYRPLAIPDEGRYVEIPREMVVSGDFVTPHLNGLPYFEKPPLFYWIESFFVSQFGVHNTFALRLSTALLGLLGCLFLYIFAYTALGRKVGLWSAVILGTNVLYFLLSRLLILDLALTIFMTIALLSFWQAAHASRKKWWLSLYGTGLAASVLTKGLIGVVLPGGIILAWILWTRRFSVLKIAFHPLSLTVFFVLALPWHILVSLQNPEFPYFYFIHEHFLRYTTTIHSRHQPFWFFAPVVLLGFFPWVSFVPQSVRLLKCAPDVLPKGFVAFLTIWIGVVFCFFSLSSSKLIPYILPIFSPLALLVGTAATHFSRDLMASFWGYAGLTAFVILGLILYIPLDSYFLGASYDVYSLAPVVGLGALLLLSGIATGWLWRKKSPEKVLIGIAVSTFFFLGTAAYIDRWVQPRPSSLGFATLLKAQLSEDTPVIVYGFYPQDLPVYLQRTVQIFDYAGELHFGASIRPHQDRILSNAGFEELWTEKKPAHVLLRYSGEDPMRRYRELQHTFPSFSFHIRGIHPPFLWCSNVP